MDPLLAVAHLPKLAEQAMRASVIGALQRGRMAHRAVIDDALVRFERDVQSYATEGVRPAVLFAERDRIVRELRGFIDGRLAARLAEVRRRDLVATAVGSAPFDAIVRNRFGDAYARRAQAHPSWRKTARSYSTHRAGGRTLQLRSAKRSGPLRLHISEHASLGGSAESRFPPLGGLAALYDAGTQRVNCNLRARCEMQFREDVRDVILHRFVRQLQSHADLFIRKTFGDEADHLEFSFG